MLKELSTQLMQHLITQNSWAKERLQPYAGKSIKINIALISPVLVILEDGSLAMAGETNVPDATVNIPPSLLLRLMAKDEAAKLQIRVEGDTHLATELAKVFEHIRWDYEDDLSKVVGDIPANKIANFTETSAKVIKDTTINLAEMLSEYWQEEQPMIAKKRHVEQFISDVDSLRSDVERLDKKLAKLMQKVTHADPLKNNTH